MKKQPNKKKKELVTKEISTEQNAVYSDPKDAKKYADSSSSERL
ncbi:hypothetical protein ACUC2M_14885 [Bacillus cytotoxicus]